MESLECYLVGGAVRDELLGAPVQDRDWVVVGSTPEQMTALGFIQVGRDFPVFLHPETKEEYALARTERKRGSGHKGFVVDANADVTLEEDLRRRDLTINAIARDRRGKLIDPYQGERDLRAGVLRHVSAAFVEDPLRVFRVARFAAQLSGFQVAPETLTLMGELSRSGELSALSAERVWAELEKALAVNNAEVYFSVLGACGGLEPWLVELQHKAVTFPALPLNAGERFALLPLDPGELQRLSRRLKAPKAVVLQAEDFHKFGSLLAGWRRLPAAQLCDVLVEMKVVHDMTRLRRLCRLVALLNGVAFDDLLTIAEGLRRVAVNRQPPLQGPAYGRALRQARIGWLRQQL